MHWRWSRRNTPRSYLLEKQTLWHEQQSLGRDIYGRLLIIITCSSVHYENFLAVFICDVASNAILMEAIVAEEVPVVVGVGKDNG